jgi:hypothetical protein
MEGALDRPVLDLGLRDRGLEVNVPHGRGLDAVDVALLEEVPEGELREGPAARVDGGVLLAPVDREPEPPPERLEGLLVLARQLEAEVDEVPPRDAPRRLLQPRPRRRIEAEVGLVVGVGVAAHVVVVLHAPLGREPVVVPPHGVEDVAAAHALVAGDDVGVRVAEDVADVERPRHGGRRRVDDEGLSRGRAGS